MSKVIKKIVSVLLIFSLVYANLSGTIFGIVSYAEDGNNAGEVNEQEKQVEETNSLKVETKEFYKNNMTEEETEYEEALKLNLKYENKFNKIEIYDVKTEIKKALEENEEKDEEEQDVEETEKIKVFYKSTKINKESLLNTIGQDGKLELTYKQLENAEEDEKTAEVEKETLIRDEEITETDKKVLPQSEDEETVESDDNKNIEETENKEEEDLEENSEDIEKNEEELKGIIIAENGKVEINAETEADEEGFITIVYPENTENVTITIESEINVIENLSIVHTKVVEKVTDIEKVDTLETIKQIIVKQDEEEILNKQETSVMPITYTKTVADLGMDKTRNIYKYRK